MMAIGLHWGMRDILIHEYFGVNLNRAWKVISCLDGNHGKDKERDWLGNPFSISYLKASFLNLPLKNGLSEYLS